jgi:hypothetical protein
MKSKIKSVNSPKFFLCEGEVYYNQDDIKSGQVKFVETGTLKKEFFNDFIENSINDEKEVYIYSMDDVFVRCCAI